MQPSIAPQFDGASIEMADPPLKDHNDYSQCGSFAAFGLAVLQSLIRTGSRDEPKPKQSAEATMLVNEAMTTHAEWVSPDLSLTEVARRMRDSKIGCLPVGDKDRLVGMITDRDIACRAVANGSDPAKTKARDVMTKGITYCFDDQTLEDAVRMMEEKGVHHLPVLNRSKRMIGILALGDVALKAAPALLGGISKLASRDASKHAAKASHH